MPRKRKNPSPEIPALNSPDELLTEVHLERETKIRRATWKGMRHHRIGPPFIKLGRSVRYRRADVTTWLQERKIGYGGES